jgi:hypothetical protein
MNGERDLAPERAAKERSLFPRMTDFMPARLQAVFAHGLQQLRARRRQRM